jgi:DNA repair protein RecN (Recombination protein N)
VLVELHISRLGVIDDLELELHPSLNVLTGETGAGKTMVTMGLALALGGRGSGARVRHGGDRARVEARFLAPSAPAVAEWAEEGEVVLARTVSEDGKSSARIGGQIVPVSALAALGPELVEVHAQNQHQRLLSASTQTEFLDRFAGTDHLGTVRDYAAAYERARRLRLHLEELDREARQRERDKDLLAYQVREIEAAAIRPGEMAELLAEDARLGHAERLTLRGGAAEDALTADGAASDGLHAAAAALRDAGSVDPSATELSDRAAGLAAEAAELVLDLRAWLETVRVDPGRQQEVADRLLALRSLERKYGDGEPGILAYLEQARRSLGSLAGADREREELETETERVGALAAELAARITERRERSAPELSLALQAEVHELGMEGATLQVQLVSQAELGPAGRERAELLFCGAPGQPSLPIAKSASGGELSRIMLACRSVMADLDNVPTLVFDEVDAGIGGRAGAAVGRRLARLATTRQVLVVTHLAQIACFADRHVAVTKQDGVAAIRVLERDERISEIARMLSGSSGSDSARSHAVALLEEAAEERQSWGKKPSRPPSRREKEPAGRGGPRSPG